MDHNVHGFKEVGVVVVGAIPLLYYYYTIRTIFTSDFDPTGESEAACPSPLGVRPPPGCKKTFIQDTLGSVSCQDDEDCPESLQWWDDHDQQNICSKPGM